MNAVTVALPILVVFAACLAPRLAYAHQAAAQEENTVPRIEQSIPRQFVAERQIPNGESEIFLTGMRLARPDTTPHSLDKDIQVQVRVNDSDTPVPVSVTAATGETLCVRLPRNPLFKSAGKLEFRVRVRGIGESNRLTVPVLPYPTEKPIIESLALAIPRRPPGSKTPGRPERIQVRHLAPDAEVRVEGVICKVARQYPGDGYLEFIVPEELESKAGRYAITVSTGIGVSEPAYFEIVPPPSIVEFRPYSLAPLAADTKEPPVTVTIIHEGKTAPSTWIRFIPEADKAVPSQKEEAPTWEAIGAVELKSGVCVLTLPRKWLTQPGTLAIRLVTVGGESVGYLPIITPQ